VALQDLLFKKVLNLFFEVFPSFFHVYVVDITNTKIQITLCPIWLYNNYHYHFSVISTEFVSNLQWNGACLDTAHRFELLILYPLAPDSCDVAMSINSIFLCCTRGAVTLEKLSVQFSIAKYF
jgi:hypothetical protein